MTVRRIAVAVVAGTALAGAVGAATAAAAPATRYFQSPSGNIVCAIEDGATARCEILEKDWTPPPKPRTCPVDWGDGTVVTARGKRGVYLCAGDTIRHPPGKPYRVLAYGRSLRVASITCRSAKSGMTCTNLKKHGFLLSRERVRLF